MKMKKRSTFEISLFLLIVSLALGETGLFGIKLSWILSILTIIALFFSPKTKIIMTKDKIRLLQFLFFWAIYAILLFLINLEYSHSLDGILSLLVNIFVLLFLLISINNRQQISFYINAMMIGLIITFYYAFQNIYFGSYIVNIDPDLIRYRNVPVAFFGNPNDYATFIVICIFAFSIEFVVKKRIDFFKLSIIVISIFFLVQSGSRSSILALCLFIILLLFYLIFGEKMKKDDFVFYTSVTLTMIPTIFFTLFPGFFFSFIIALISDEQNIASDLYRLNIIRSNISLFLQSGLFGVGALNSTHMLGINPHNMVIEILTDYGIFTYLGYLIVTFLVLKNTRVGRNRMNKVVMYAVVPSYFVLSNASSSMLRIRYSWILFGIIYIFAALSKKHESEF